MMCLLEGVAVFVVSLMIIGIALAYLIDWDRYIKECVERVEEEWRREEHPCGRG